MTLKALTQLICRGNCGEDLLKCSVNTKERIIPEWANCFNTIASVPYVEGLCVEIARRVGFKTPDGSKKLT